MKGEASLLKSIGSYTLINILNKSIPFLLLPVLTNFLTPEDFGIITNIESLIVITTTIIGVNFSSSFIRQFVKKEVDLKSYTSTVFRLILLFFGIVSLLLFSFVDVIYEWTAIPKVVIYSISIFSLLENLIEVVLSLWRMEDKPFKYGKLRIARTIIEVSITILFVVIYQYNWWGRFFGIYTAGILTGLFSLVYLFKKGYLTQKYNPVYRSYFLRYGLPLIPHTLSGILIMYSDKLIITKYLSIGENGVYSVAFTIGMVISVLQTSFNQAWVPSLFKRLATNSMEEKRKLVKITYVYMAGILMVVFVLWLITPVIYFFLGKDFSEGMDVVAIIGLGFAFNGMYKMMVNYIFYSEKTQIISLITIGIAILNISLSIYLIKDYGILGTAYASAISFFIQFLMTWMISAIVYPMPWLLKK